MRLRDMRPGFMRDHMFTRRHLAEYLDGELYPRGRERLEHHAHLCPKCRRVVATLVRTVAGLRALGPPQPGPARSLPDAVIARLREDPG